jgi:prophage antirepressor-like protein
MTSLTVFNFRSNEVRTVTDENGDPWFVAKDLCDVLGYSNGPDALARHVDDDDRRPLDMNTIAKHDGNARGNRARVSIVNESGMYSLVLSSKKPEAKEFKKWVTSEVLPSIRKHGGYVAPAQGAAEAFVSHYLPNLSEKAKAEIVMGLSARVDELEAEKAVLAPKAEVFDELIADKMEPLTTFVRSFSGVNSNATLRDLVGVGYLYKIKAGYRVYSKYRGALFTEKRDPVYGKFTIYPTARGKQELTKLYKERKLTMKV